MEIQFEAIGWNRNFNRSVTMREYFIRYNKYSSSTSRENTDNSIVKDWSVGHGET